MKYEIKVEEINEVKKKLEEKIAPLKRLSSIREARIVPVLSYDYKKINFKLQVAFDTAINQCPAWYTKEISVNNIAKENASFIEFIIGDQGTKFSLKGEFMKHDGNHEKLLEKIDVTIDFS